MKNTDRSSPNETKKYPVQRWYNTEDSEWMFWDIHLLILQIQQLRYSLFNECLKLHIFD